MEPKSQYSTEQIDPQERLARIVLSPRDIDPVTGYPKDTFIGLRQNESGISFLRKDFMGNFVFLQCGMDRASLYSGNSKKKTFSFVGWMEGVAREIEALAPSVISLIVNEPDKRPEHVNVCFLKNGEIVKGMVTDAKILDVIDDLFHYLTFVKVNSNVKVQKHDRNRI